MYTIDIHHKGDSSATSYSVYKESEAKDKDIKYKYWRDADEGEYGLSDDGYVAKVVTRSVYSSNSIYVRYPYGYTFFNPNYTATKLKAAGRMANNTISGKTHWEVLCGQQKINNLAMVYAQTMDYGKAINLVLDNPSRNQERMWKRRMKTEKFKDMVRDELQKLLHEHGMTESYTLDLLEETIKKAKDKGDVTNLMRAVDNLQDMHGMKDKNLIKTTEQIESTSNVKLIDELREEEEKLIATKTTVKEEK
jgi:hypothetical protein